MPTYHYLFIGLADRVGKVETMECTDDSVAHTCAGSLLDRYAFGAVEIWAAGRRVHRAEKPHCPLLVS